MTSSKHQLTLPLGACLVAGLLISLGMLARSQVGGDQLNLLARGWLLAEEGRLVPHGNPMSTGGNEPGPLTSLLVGLPLFVWQDHRAPTVVVLLFHLAAWLLLDRVVARVLSPRGRLLVAVLFWLNPWRLYFSGFLWNPNYLFLFGAVHTWSCFAQRRRAAFWPTFLQVLAVGLVLQIHASFVLLVIASALLFWRGYFKVHWWGVAAGVAATALSLAPWLAAIGEEPAIVAADRGFLGFGLVTVYPVLRGVLYWLRYSSLAVSERFLDLDFTWLVGARADAVLAPSLAALVAAGGFLTLAVPFIANLRLFRRGRCRRGDWRPARRWRRKLPAGASDRAWLAGYTVHVFAAAVVVFCLTPTTIMMWQIVIFLHVAVLPLVLWAEALWRTRHRARVEAGLKAWAAASVVLAIVMMLGSPHYRCGGRERLVFPLRYDYPMLDDLGINATCRWPVDPEGWEPDVLPPPDGAR